MYYTKAIIIGLATGLYYGEKSIPPPILYTGADKLRASRSIYKRQ